MLNQQTSILQSIYQCAINNGEVQSTNSSNKGHKGFFRTTTIWFVKQGYISCSFIPSKQIQQTLAEQFRERTKNGSLRTVPTNGKYFFLDNDYVRQIDRISGF